MVLHADPAKVDKKEDAKKAEAAPGPKYDDKAFAEAWGTEWKHGDVPSWKETYPKSALKYEDRQSDGKRSKASFLQAEPKDAGLEQDMLADTEQAHDADAAGIQEDEEEAKKSKTSLLQAEPKDAGLEQDMLADTEQA